MTARLGRVLFGGLVLWLLCPALAALGSRLRRRPRRWHGAPRPATLPGE